MNTTMRMKISMGWIVTMFLMACSLSHATVLVTSAAGSDQNAQLLQGRPMSSTAPADTNVITWNATDSMWEPLAGGAGGGANTALGNLASVAINASLLPAVDQAIDVGGSSKNFTNGYIENLIAASITPAAGVNFGLSTANNGAGNSGNIAMTIGSASGSQGAFQMAKVGVSNSIGDVWTATATNGVGYWAASAGDFKKNGSVTATGAFNMGSHQINLVTDPTSAQDAATKNYVDTVASALNPIQGVTAASTGDYPGTMVANVYTITATGALSMDGQSPANGTRVLLKNQSTQANNGVYTVTTAGSVGVSPVLTRASDYNTAAEVNAGDLVPVINGTVNGTTSWLQSSTVTTLNTDALVFTQWTYNIQPVAKGGTGLASGTSGGVLAYTASGTLASSAALTANQLVIGGGAGVVPSSLAAGSQYQVLRMGASNPAYGSVNLDQAAAVTGVLLPVDGGYTAPNGIANCSINSSVAANALTVLILTAAGNTPSATDPCIIAFRNTSATTGTYSLVSVTAATTAVITDTGTMGCTIGTICPLYVYAQNNAGTINAAVASEKMLDESVVQSSTTASSGSTTMGTLYATTGVASTAVRLLGELQITLGASSHWSANSTKISNVPFQPFLTNWTAFTPVLTAGSGSMTNVTFTGMMKRHAQNVKVFGKMTFTGAPGTWGRIQIAPPINCTIDTASMVGDADVAEVGGGIALVAGAADYAFKVMFTSSGRYTIEALSYDGSAAGVAYVKIADASQAIPATWASGDKLEWWAEFPCTGW